MDAGLGSGLDYERVWHVASFVAEQDTKGGESGTNHRPNARDTASDRSVFARRYRSFDDQGSDDLDGL